MAGPSIAVLADDLTGAAEIAAIGKRHGLPSRIFASTAQSRPFSAGLSVHDTDSRLLTAAKAAERVTATAASLGDADTAFIFKKTDSVLRGNVVAEIVAFARATGKRRILLVPANPSLGRTISKGQYFVQEVPIAETNFARDPHHPAKSSSIVELLGPSPDWPVSVLASGAPLPEQGIIVGETTTSADVAHWAAHLDRDTLAAGGADFFQACLKQFGLAPKPTSIPKSPGLVLIVTGSLTPARETLLAHASSVGWPVHTIAGDFAALRRTFEMSSIILVQSPKTAVNDQALGARLRADFGELVRRLRSQVSLGQVVVEGGATAAAISEANGWTSFDVAGEWAPGVIALHPTAAPEILFTIKPGSYTWPENLWRQLDSCRVSFSKS
ncbi:MAG: four-carbon acid sugar kinase family protein [Nibricoccus sp.]